MKIRLYFLLILLYCLGVSSQSRLDYFLIQAGKFRMAEQWSEATALYNHCLEIDSGCAEAKFQLGRIKFFTRQDSLGLTLIERAVVRDSANPYYLESLAGILLRMGNETSALPVLEQISHQQTKRTDILSHLVSLYSRLGRTNDAISTINRWETLEGKNAGLSYEKFTLYIDAGDSISAFEELEKLCDEYPADQTYRIRLGYQYQKRGNIGRAMQIYDQVRRADPSNISLQMAMMEYYRDSGQDSLYVHTRDSVLLSPNTDSRYRISLLQTTIQGSRDDSLANLGICQLFERILVLDSLNTDVYSLYAAFLSYRQFPEENMRTLMHRLLHVHPDSEMATQWLIQYYGTRQDYPALEEICRRGVNYHPEELVYAYFLAMALVERDDGRSVVEVVKRSLSSRKENSRPTLVSDMFGILGDMYFRLKMYKESFCACDSAVAYNIDNISCLNNYAYYLSIVGENLVRAEEMSYRTIKAEPNNKTYLDTYAWILFMQMKYSQAQNYMGQVVPADSTDEFLLAAKELSPTLIEHAADIAWMNGDRSSAVRFWNLAVRKNPGQAGSTLLKKQRRQRYFRK